MRVVSFTEARNNLNTVLDDVVIDADTTIITRRNAEDTVVISPGSYNRSIAQYQSGQSTSKVTR
jgi:antitoxin YefM